MIQEINLYDKKLGQHILDMDDIDSMSKNISMILIPESDYGLAEIYKIYDDILVFLIPTYGGIPSFYKSYDKGDIDSLIEDLKNIT